MHPVLAASDQLPVPSSCLIHGSIMLHFQAAFCVRHSLTTRAAANVWQGSTASGGSQLGSRLHTTGPA